MASRADVVGVELEAATAPLPAPPSLGRAFRAALQDGYYHSWRLVPANVLWSAVLLVITALILATPIAIVLLPLLALPTAGMFRITTRIVRGETVSFWDAIDAWRRDVRSTLLVGTGFAAAAVVLASNVVLGLTSGSPLGWGLATFAGWGLVAAWILAWALWPILTDPRRADQPLGARLRLAALLVLAHPIRIALLAVVLGVLLAASAAAVVALAMISLAFAALVASRIVLPAADRLERRLLERVSSGPVGLGDSP